MQNRSLARSPSARLDASNPPWYRLPVLYKNDDLHFIREHEIELLAGYLRKGSRVLELGAGTGYQAQALTQRGFEVEAIDLPESRLSLSRVFPVTDYDGKAIPFPDASFDIVFSSNVLEHIRDLGPMLGETTRVLKPGGYAIHAMPSPFWRFWTTVAGPLDWPLFLMASLTGNTGEPRRARQESLAFRLAKGTVARFVPLRHGEKGNAMTELVTFSKRAWVRAFERHGFEVIAAEPMNTFYTGWFLLGRRWPMQARQRAARLLGSACWVYHVRPRANADT
jgi:ubiquinone/menaquinone biosynthesis C-methylase UbiE